MTIRPATLADVPALCALMARSMAALGPGFYPPDRADAAARYLTVPDEALIEDGTLYVAEGRIAPHPYPSPPEGRGVLLGVGGWSSRAKLFTGSADQEVLTERLNPVREAARIRAFFVDPEATRRGVARAIFERCAADAQAAGFRGFALMATLPGVPLYRALGFGDERPTRILLPDGTGLDCVAMGLSFL